MRTDDGRGAPARRSPVRLVPDLQQQHGRVESMEYDQRQRDPGQQAPRKQAHETQLPLLAYPALRDERVEHPQGDIAAQQVRDHLRPYTNETIAIYRVMRLDRVGSGR